MLQCPHLYGHLENDKRATQLSGASPAYSLGPLFLRPIVTCTCSPFPGEGWAGGGRLRTAWLAALQLARPAPESPIRGTALS